MTQEEKIKEKLWGMVETCTHGEDEFLDTQHLLELFLEWHTTELNRRMEEVIDKFIEDNFQDHFKRSVEAKQTADAGGIVILDDKELAIHHYQASIIQRLLDLKSLLNEKEY